MRPHPLLAGSAPFSGGAAAGALVVAVILTLATAMLLVLGRFGMRRSSQGRGAPPGNVWRVFWRTCAALAVIWVLTLVVGYLHGLPSYVGIVVAVIDFLLFFAGMGLDLETYRSRSAPRG